MVYLVYYMVGNHTIDGGKTYYICTLVFSVCSDGMTDSTVCSKPASLGYSDCETPASIYPVQRRVRIVQVRRRLNCHAAGTNEQLSLVQ